MTWEAIFFLAVLKIPVLYVLLVVWWAIRAQPGPSPDLQTAALERRLPRGPRPVAGPRRPHRGGPGPRGGEPRRAARRARVRA